MNMNDVTPVEAEVEVVAVCAICECELYDGDYYDVTNDTRETVCDDCAVLECYTCTSCGYRYRGGGDSIGGDWYCQDCFYEVATYCADCGEAIWLDDAICHDGETYCEACAPSDDDFGFSDLFRRMDSNGDIPSADTITVGIEMEFHTDSWCDRERVAEHLSRYEWIAEVKGDSSLAHGVEVVTHPLTLEYWQYHIRAQLESMLGIMKDSGAYVNTNSGIHVHVSRNAGIDYDDSAHERILLSMAQQYERIIRTVCGRDSSYAHVPWDSALQSTKGYRYQTFNCQNYETIEYRAPISTLTDVEHIGNNIVFAVGMMRAASMVDCDRPIPSLLALAPRVREVPFLKVLARAIVNG